MSYTTLIPLIEKFFPRVVFRVPVKEKIIFLTFDDGPNPEITPHILDYLEKFDARATFFVKGNQIPSAPGILVRMKKERHSIGNHGFSHISLWTKKKNTILDEIGRTNELIEKTCGFRPAFFRPPYGNFRPGFPKLLDSFQMRVVLWSLDSRDYRENESPQSIVRNVLLAATPGTIVLLHDSGKNSWNSLQALPVILGNLKNQGYQFASLGDKWIPPNIQETVK